MLHTPLFDEPARQALRDAAALLDAAERSGRPLEISQALVVMARGHAALPALASAETYLLRALRWAHAAGSTDHTVDLLCELCEAAIAQAAALDLGRLGAGHATRERVRDHAFEAATLAGCVADPEWEVKVLLRISDVLDRCGNRDDAVLLQTRALRLTGGGRASATLDPAVLPSLGRRADT